MLTVTLQGFMLMKAAFFFILFSGCAYNYAGQNSEQTQTKEKRQNVKVVTLEPTEEIEIERKVDVKQVETSKCGLSRFSVFWRKGKEKKEYVVDCKTRKVVSKKMAHATDTLTYPEEIWYFYVDPHDLGKAEINNTHLLKLSQEFKIEFFGQERTQGVLIYTFLDPI